MHNLTERVQHFPNYFIEQCSRRELLGQLMIHENMLIVDQSPKPLNTDGTEILNVLLHLPHSTLDVKRLLHLACSAQW